MKVTVIGGGSTYTPELASGLLARQASLPITELWLMDIVPQRLAIVAGLIRRMVSAENSPMAVIETQDRRRAIDGATYVVTQMRVGGMAARRADEYLGRRHGLIGQETTGVGGMAKALRTIPPILDVATDVRQLAPSALVINFSNPSGLVTEALSRYAPDVQSAGLCNGPFTAKMEMLHGLEARLAQSIEPERCELDTLGLNHLAWYRSFRLDGRDMWPQVLESTLARLRATGDPEWDPDTLEALGVIPCAYLRYYYYTGRMLAEQQRWPPSRAEEVMAIEAELLRQYADTNQREPPPDLMKRGGAYYSTVAAQLMAAHLNDLGETHVVNVPNRGAVGEWPVDWVLELPCRIGVRGIEPLPARALPPVCAGLLAHVKAYELLAVEAAVHGDRRAAYQALLAHPLGPPAARVKAVLDDMLATHRDYLPQFWPDDRG